MDKVLAFFKTRTGKIVIGIVVLIAIAYGVMYFLEKKKYGGSTKKQIESAILSGTANEYIQMLIDTDPAVQELGIYEVAFWHDNNRNIVVTSRTINNAFLALGVSPEFMDEFKHLEGQKVVLVDYV